jgi:hypothetical protein
VADELAKTALTRASRSREMRLALPLGTDLLGDGPAPDDVEAVRAALLEALQQVDAGDLLAGLAGSARAAQRPAPLAPLAQAEAANALTETSPVALRAHVAAVLVPAAGGRTVLRSRVGTIAVERTDLAAIEGLLDRGRATAAELGLELTRTLLRSGVVVPA